MGQYIKLVYQPAVREKENPDQRLYGMFDEETDSIYIEDGMPHNRERDTLIHEVLHQLFSMSGIEFKGEMEETVTAYLGGAILSHMRDNGKFWRYVMEPAPKEEDDDKEGEHE